MASYLHVLPLLCCVGLSWVQGGLPAAVALIEHSETCQIEGHNVTGGADDVTDATATATATAVDVVLLLGHFRRGLDVRTDVKVHVIDVDLADFARYAIVLISCYMYG